jgi:ubiquinone/menaquinone biosynthesis C-methylase UbiE
MAGSSTWAAARAGYCSTRRAKADQDGVSIHLLQANLTELDCLAAESFDCAACLFSTLGMVRGESERERVVAHAYRLLKPGGRFVLHVHNRWFNSPAARRPGC